MINLLVGVFGAFFIIAGYFYNKEYHNKKFSSNFSNSTAGSGSGVEAVIIFIIGVIASIFPWYVIRVFFFLLGIFFIYVAFNL
jgi:hypothetical protein